MSRPTNSVAYVVTSASARRSSEVYLRHKRAGPKHGELSTEYLSCLTMLTREEECKTGGNISSNAHSHSDVNITVTDDSDEQDSLASHPDPTRVIPDTRGNVASVTVAQIFPVL